MSANVFEAKAASSRKDYINFYLHALKSANESKFWINLLVDSKKIDEKTGMEIFQETKEIANILGASVVTMKNKK